MTTRPRPSVPGPPAVRLRDPAGVVAAVPYLLGFEPRRSLVVVGVDRDEGVGPTLRVDLDVSEASLHLVVATWAHARAVMVRNGCRSVLAVLYTDADPSEPAPGLAPTSVGAVLQGVAAPVGDLADAPPTRPAPDDDGEGEYARRGADASGQATDVRVLDVIQVGPGRFRSLVCQDPDCCPVTGSPRSEASSHPVAATFVLAGRSPVADRQQTAPEDTSVTAADAATARAAAATARAGAPRTGSTGPGTARRPRARQVGAAARERLLVRRWAACLPACPDPELAGQLVAGWRGSSRLRDACLAHFLPGGEQLADALVAPTGDRGGRALARVLADPACAGTARHGDAVLRRLAALTDGADRATVEAAHAWLAWASGDGTAAGVLADRSLAADPGQSLARLVAQCLQHGVGPSWTTASPSRARLRLVGPP